MTIFKKQYNKITQLCIFLSYGTNWIEFDGDDDSYGTGGLETLAHCISCFLYQEFQIEMDTAECRDHFLLEDRTWKDLEEMFIALIKSEKKE